MRQQTEWEELQDRTLERKIRMTAGGSREAEGRKKREGGC